MTWKVPTRRIFSLGLGASLITGAQAHPDHQEGVTLLIWKAKWYPDEGRIACNLTIENKTGGAVTLRTLSASHGTGLTFERRRKILGHTSWQPASFLRLEPGEAINLAQPDFRIELHGIEAPKRRRIPFELTADFGPMGKVRAGAVAW